MTRLLTIAVLLFTVAAGPRESFGRGGASRGGGGSRGGGASRGGAGGGGFSGSMGGSRGGQMSGGQRGQMGGGGGNVQRGQASGGAQRGQMQTRQGGEGAGTRGGQAGVNRGGASGAYRGGAAGSEARFGGAGEGAGRTAGEATPSRSQMNQFLGMPSDGGMHAATNRPNAGDYSVNKETAEGPRGGVAAGAAVTGPNGNTAARGAAVGPNGGVAAGRGVEGAGGGRVAQGAAVGPEGRAAGGTVARGADGAVAGRGAVVGERGAVGGYAYRSPSARYGDAYGVRAGFTGHALYSPDWYGAHPGAWTAAGLTAAAWNAASWNSMSSWFGTTAAPVYYNYGSNVATQGDNVYVDGQDAGTTDQYYQQAADLADTGAQAPAGDDQNWLPLGVFAITQSDQTNSNMVLQLAVDKQGTIRGNFTDTTSNNTLPVQGSVDKQSQRAAWTIGDKQDEVMETGLYNLTKDEVPALLHYGKDKTEQWTLVRVKQSDDAAGQPAPSQ